MPRIKSWSIKICQIKGIPVAVHASFFLLLIWVAFEEIRAGNAPLSEVVFVLALFACVVFHELGHALVARRFGIRTRDIVLYPFGGVASVLSEAAPGPEIFIAAAGPAASLLLAALFYPLSNFSDSALITPAAFTTRLFIANLVLAIFNLLPAFPMDGGRILRAVLGLVGFKRATELAAGISQVLTLLLAGFALYIGNEILILVALFVFLNAFQEFKRARRQRHFESGLRAGQF